jgi:hypothetical protein
MSMITKTLALLKSVLHAALTATGGLFALRHDWPECCRDSDHTRRAVEAMRDECWRTGV